MFLQNKKRKERKLEQEKRKADSLSSFLLWRLSNELFMFALTGLAGSTMSTAFTIATAALSLFSADDLPNHHPRNERAGKHDI